MIRGEIRLVDLEPAVGAEANKRRPVVIVSNDGANAAAASLGRGVITVVPVTSNVDRVYPFQVKLTAGVNWAAHGLQGPGGASSLDLRSTHRASGRSPFPADVMNLLDEALRLHLAL